MQAQRKRQIRRVWQIAVAWTFVGAFMTVYDHFLLHSHISVGHLPDYSFGYSLTFNVFAGSVGGAMGGAVLVGINRRIRSKPYIYALLWGSVFFFLIIVFMMVTTAAMSMVYFHGFDYSSPAAQAFFKSQIWTTFHLKNIILWIVVTLITQFCLKISEKFGPGNLWNILTGKYHIPKNEKRIFMFLDLKSSTTIAEKLGEEKYHEFLQQVFMDVTDPINNGKAEIYQYVGDEVIISWNLEKTKEKPDCLNVFFDIENEFKKNKEKYIEKYDVTPKFKAGAHIGNAIAGEIGIIKRDITYSGDLLNTTARIQGQCNEFNSVFLISGQLKDYLNPNNDQWSFQSKGFISLRGKEKKVELLDVKQA